MIAEGDKFADDPHTPKALRHGELKAVRHERATHWTGALTVLDAPQEAVQAEGVSAGQGHRLLQLPHAHWTLGAIPKSRT